MSPLALLLTLALPSAGSYGPALKLERVNAAQCATEGWIEAYAIELTLEGRLALHPASAHRLVIDGAPTEAPPIAHRSFIEKSAPLHVTLVVQDDGIYRADLSALKAALALLVERLPNDALLSVIRYAAQPSTLLELGTPQDAQEAIAALRARGAGPSSIVPAVTAGLLTFPKGTPGRKLLVLVSDGRPIDQNRDQVRALGDEAQVLGVSIHPLAYSPTDERQALLHLAELAKRTHGTFRWAQNAGALREVVTTLTHEITKQQVLRFAMPDRCGSPHEVQLLRGSIRSNPRRTPALQARGRSWLWVGLLVIIGLLGFLGVRWVIVRRRA